MASTVDERIRRVIHSDQKPGQADPLHRKSIRSVPFDCQGHDCFITGLLSAHARLESLFMKGSFVLYSASSGACFKDISGSTSRCTQTHSAPVVGLETGSCKTRSTDKPTENALLDIHHIRHSKGSFRPLFSPMLVNPPWNEGAKWGRGDSRLPCIVIVPAVGRIIGCK